jgi:hypothetical protein
MANIGLWCRRGLLAAFLLASAASVSAATAPLTTSTFGYADLADLALAAPAVAVVTVHDTVRLKGPDAVGVPAGGARLYVDGDVTALIAGKGGLPARISWLVDVPLMDGNRVPKLKKQQVILFARPIPGKPGTLQLVARDAQLAWSPDVESRVRAILTAAAAPDAPPVVTDVGHAFHVPGSIPGEGETQIFLKTKDNRPVSLSILRRPGEQPRWSVALGEMVDDAAAAPARDTLLWYRLACSLPPSLSDGAVADQQPDDAAAARADYALVLSGLGKCGRTRPAS